MSSFRIFSLNVSHLRSRIFTSQARVPDRLTNLVHPSNLPWKQSGVLGVVAETYHYAMPSVRGSEGWYRIGMWRITYCRYIHL